MSLRFRIYLFYSQIIVQRLKDTVQSKASAEDILESLLRINYDTRIHLQSYSSVYSKIYIRIYYAFVIEVGTL